MQTPKSPSLEVISEAAEAHERRRTPRLLLASEQFRLKQNGKIFSVIDLSADGMALRIVDPLDRVLFPIGGTIEGLLKLNGEKHPIQARIKRVTVDTVGCELQSLDEIVSNALKQFLDPEVLGGELKPIPVSELGTLWYHGPSGTDLLIKRGVDGQIRRFILYVMGTFTQWDEETGITTGVTQTARDKSEQRGIVRFETLFLQNDSTPDPNKLRIAKTVVLSSNLPQEMKKWCARRV